MHTVQRHPAAINEIHHLNSDQLPMMQLTLTPHHMINAEPVFLEHLLVRLGKTIQIVTFNGTMEGVLTGVSKDHLQLSIGEEYHHIRFKQVIYYKKDKTEHLTII